MIAQSLPSFDNTLALILYVIKEAHPNSKMTYYRFPKEKAKYCFDPKTEFSILKESEKLSTRWCKNSWE